MKELCNCGKMAVWVYAPGFSSGASPYFCNDCVPRGCSCNHHHIKEEEYDDTPTAEDNPIKWIKEGEIWCHIDEQGREYPCCEYDYDEDGFNKEELNEEAESKD